jgi:hypothetical protein
MLHGIQAAIGLPDLLLPAKRSSTHVLALVIETAKCKN